MTLTRSRLQIVRRTVLAGFACACLAAPVAAQPSGDHVRSIVRTVVDAVGDLPRTSAYQQGREEQTERLTKTVRIGADGEIDVSNIAGDIVVTRGSGSDATIEAVKTARGRTADDARQMLGLVQVDITERAGRVEVRTNYPRGEENRRNNRRNISVSVAYTITAPPGTRMTLASISGNVRVTDIKGDLSVNSISGDLRIANAGRIASAKSISGAVEIADTQIDGTLEAGSVSGSVVVRRVRARRVDLGTVSGNVVLQDVQCDRVQGHSVSGNVEFSGVLSRNGRYEMNSHSGEIRIAIPGDVGFELDASSFSGSVRSDLPLTLRGREGGDRGRQHALRGVHGDGSAVLDVTTFSGSIVITKR
jgi:DUF4097 and DUF4098 domain-containing protein YvlB